MNENLKIVKANIQRYRWLLQTKLTKARRGLVAEMLGEQESELKKQQASSGRKLGPTPPARPSIRPALLGTVVLRGVAHSARAVAKVGDDRDSYDGEARLAGALALRQSGIR